MLESIVEFFVSMKELWPVVAPFVPYLATMLVVGQIMKRSIKPYVKSHRFLNGEFDSPAFEVAHRLMVFCPMALGALCGLACTLSGIGGNILAYVASGAVAQWTYGMFVHWNKERGVRESQV